MDKRRERIADRWGEVYPGINDYMNCISRAYMHGVASFAIVFPSAYALQRLTAHRHPITANGSILVSALLASVVTFKVSKDRVAACNQAWCAAEEKHTYFNPLPEAAHGEHTTFFNPILEVVDKPKDLTDERFDNPQSQD